MGADSHDSNLDRRRLVAGLCALGSLTCLGCSRLGWADPGKEKPSSGFATMSEMTFEEVFRFAYVGSFIPTMKVLAGRIGLEAVQSAACDAAAAETGRRAAALPDRGLASWAAQLKSPSRLWKHVLGYEIVEDTERVFAVRVTRCLWATTFRGADAAELGYAWVCHPDFAMATAFNPAMRLTRDATLMQGDSHCNHRWEIMA